MNFVVLIPSKKYVYDILRSQVSIAPRTWSH